MVYALTDEKKDSLFSQIEILYDLTDEIANAIGAQGIENRPQQFDIANPLMLQLYGSTEKISTIYANCLKEEREITTSEKQDMENAFQHIFLAIGRFSESAEVLPKPPGFVPYRVETGNSLSTPLMEGIRNQKSGTLQSRLKQLFDDLGPNHGGRLVNATLAAGDHAAGLVFAMEKLFGIDIEKAMPRSGMASGLARKGVTVNDDLQVVKAKMDPRFISKN